MTTKRQIVKAAPAREPLSASDLEVSLGRLREVGERAAQLREQLLAAHAAVTAAGAPVVPTDELHDAINGIDHMWAWAQNGRVDNLARWSLMYWISQMAKARSLQPSVTAEDAARFLATHAPEFRSFDPKIVATAIEHWNSPPPKKDEKPVSKKSLAKKDTSNEPWDSIRKLCKAAGLGTPSADNLRRKWAEDSPWANKPLDEQPDKQGVRSSEKRRLEIIRLRQGDMTIDQIAEALSCDRKTVMKYLKDSPSPKAASGAKSPAQRRALTEK